MRSSKVFSNVSGGNTKFYGRSASTSVKCARDMVASRSDRKNVPFCHSCESLHWTPVCGKKKKQGKVYSSNSKSVFMKNKYSVLDYDSMPDQRRIYSTSCDKKYRNYVKHDDKSHHIVKKYHSRNDKNHRNKKKNFGTRSFVSINRKSGNVNKTFIKDFKQKSSGRQEMV